MTSVELAPMAPGDCTFVIGPTAISSAIERIRAAGTIDQNSIPEVIAGFPLIPSEADIDFAKWYVRWTALARDETASAPPKTSGSLKG